MVEGFYLGFRLEAVMAGRRSVLSHPSRDETARRMGQQLLMSGDQDDAMLRHRTAAHLASSMCAVDDLGPKLDANLTLVSYVPPLAGVLVKHDIALLSVDDHARGFFPDDEP